MAELCITAPVQLSDMTHEKIFYMANGKKVILEYTVNITKMIASPFKKNLLSSTLKAETLLN